MIVRLRHELAAFGGFRQAIVAIIFKNIDKLAVFTYFLDIKLLFHIHLQKDQIPDPIGFVICNL